MNKRYIVRLTDEERRYLHKLVSTGVAAAYKIKHAYILLKVDADGPHWTANKWPRPFLAIATRSPIYANGLSNKAWKPL